MEEVESKQCRRCAQVKALSEFSRKSRAKDGLQLYCKACARDIYVAHYKEHKQKIVAPNIARTKKNRPLDRQFVWDYLLAHPRVDCGESDPIVLEFDHVRGDKRGNVSQMAQGECSLQNLTKEIEKCAVPIAIAVRLRYNLVGISRWLIPRGLSSSGRARPLQG